MASITANIDTTWSTSNLTASFNVNVGWYTDPKTHIIYKGYYAAGSLDGTKLFGELKYSASTFTTNLTIPAGYHLLSVSATNANSGESASWNADIQNFRNATSAQTVFGHDNTAGSNHIDIVYGSAFGDAFILGQNDDIVEAGGGNDFLDGGTGADRLVGGEGDDTYVVDNLGDVTYEATKEGFDTVQSSLTWTLGANVEELQLTGTAAINGTGNDAANTLRGNSAANILYGLGGNDLLFGNGGNDTLDGGAGADTLRGGLGNDTYVVDNAGDKVIEAAGEGTDKAIASVNYTLAAGSAVEQLTAKAGTTAINLGGNELGQTISGNEGANTLSGNGGNDTLLGLGGNDRLFGGAGNDVLTGGAGHDLFYFNTALTANVDTITDFNVADDTIVLDHAIFAALAAGTLAAGAFAANTTGLAGDASDRIIYETDTGKLFYDANGSAAGGAVQFATVGHDLALTYNDFLVI